MYDDKLIVSYNEKNKVLYVRSAQTITFEQKVKFGHWYDVLSFKEEVLFRVQLIHEGGRNYEFKVEGIDEDDQPEGYDIYDILNNQDIKIYKGDKYKSVLVQMKIQNSEYEYYSKSLHQIPSDMTVEQFADNHARDFYGKFSHSDGDWHYFNGGEVAVKDYCSQEVSKKDYNVLQRFI